MSRAAWALLARGARLVAGLLTRAARQCFRAASGLEPVTCTACGRVTFGVPHGWAWIPSVPYRGALVAYCPRCHGAAARKVTPWRRVS